MVPNKNNVNANLVIIKHIIGLVRIIIIRIVKNVLQNVWSATTKMNVNHVLKGTLKLHGVELNVWELF